MEKGVLRASNLFYHHSEILFKRDNGKLNISVNFKSIK